MILTPPKTHKTLHQTSSASAQPIDPTLLANLQQHWVLRLDVCEALAIKTGVRARLTSWAGRNGHVVERRFSGQRNRVLYRLRTTMGSEAAGSLIEVEEMDGVY